jgi:hypothetical protein
LNLTNPQGTKGRLSDYFGDMFKTIWAGIISKHIPHVFMDAMVAYSPHLGEDLPKDPMDLFMVVLYALHQDFNRNKESPMELLDEVRKKEIYSLAKINVL